ncbi:hypothetical protein VI817_001249 [Penicillium citrinum]|nr:hypothetical protein VI817_001249 [Penicillium citrinum]
MVLLSNDVLIERTVPTNACDGELYLATSSIWASLHQLRLVSESGAIRVPYTMMFWNHILIHFLYSLRYLLASEIEDSASIFDAPEAMFEGR